MEETDECLPVADVEVSLKINLYLFFRTSPSNMTENYSAPSGDQTQHLLHSMWVP